MKIGPQFDFLQLQIRAKSGSGSPSNSLPNSFPPAHLTQHLANIFCFVLIERTRVAEMTFRVLIHIDEYCLFDLGSIFSTELTKFPLPLA